MLKEHAIETLGAPDLWTMGNGGSGGSIQQLMTAQNYPGILDGLLPSNSFPDSSLLANADCQLLYAYFESAAGSSLTPQQRMAITGMANPEGCTALGAGDSPLDAREGCAEGKVGPGIYDPRPTRRASAARSSTASSTCSGRSRRPANRCGRSTTSASSRAGSAAVGSDQPERVPQAERADRRLQRRWHRADRPERRQPGGAAPLLRDRPHRPRRRRAGRRTDRRRPRVRRRAGQRPPLHQHLQLPRAPAAWHRVDGEPRDVPGRRWRHQADAPGGNRDAGELDGPDRRRSVGRAGVGEGRRQQAGNRRRRLLDGRRPADRRARRHQRRRHLRRALQPAPAPRHGRRPSPSDRPSSSAS